MSMNPIKNILSTVPLLACAALSWYLLTILVENSEVISQAVAMKIYAGIALMLLIGIYLNITNSSAQGKDKSSDARLEKIIEAASIDPDQTRKAVIRLRQILEPDQMKLAISLAILLENLLDTIDSTNKQSEIHQQENISISNTANKLQKERDFLVEAPRLRSEFISRMGDEITTPMDNLGSMMKLLKKMEMNHEAREIY